MATKTGANLLDSILQSTGVTLNSLLTATLTAKLQQMIDAGTDSNLAVSIAVSGFSTDINAATDIPELSDTVATNVALIEAADEGEVILFPPYGGSDPQVFTLTPDAAAINEGSTLTFTVTAAKPVTEDTVVTFDVIPTSLEDDISTDAGTTGTNLNDFATGSLTRTVTIAAGTTTATFTVTPENDEATELSEGFSVKATVNGQELMVDATLLDGEAAGIPLTLTPSDDGSTMRLTGAQNVRIDFTDPTNQITGLDLDFDGTIENNGVENAVDVMPASDFIIVDAYSRDLLNEGNTTDNFLGDIAFDGTGWEGDGVNTDGVIFLGGLGEDTARAGIGNDFLTGGGVADAGTDRLYGGRNADFFFVDLSDLSDTDADALQIDGGQTTDDSAVVGDTAMDSDWLLLEVADDEDGTVVDLSGDGDSLSDADTQSVTSGNSASMVRMAEIEHVDASGNLFGFLNDIDVALGENGMVVDGENVGIGSTAQLHIIGSDQGNILIGGYDNDLIEGGTGDDLLMGGNLAYNNNPNIQGIVNDGTDELFGEIGDDNIVFEADGGLIDGGLGEDTLWLTNQSLGTQSVTELTEDDTLRFDLLAQDLDDASGYGGDDTVDTQDQTNYSDGDTRVELVNMESIIATGLGDIDFLAAGTNDPELVFNNQQNFFGYEGDLTLRGTDGNVVNQLLPTGEFVEVEDANDTWTYTITYTLGAGARDGEADDFLEEFEYQETYDSAVGEDEAVEDFLNTFPDAFPSVVNIVNVDVDEAKGNDEIDIVPVEELDVQAIGGENTLYANTGNDILEGRKGIDQLSGGLGNDDFIFQLEDGGDDLDVIWRQLDADGDNIWDTTSDDNWDSTGSGSLDDEEINWEDAYGQDFGLDRSAETMESVLQISITRVGGNLPGEELGGVVNQVSEVRTGVMVDGAFEAVVLNTQEIKDARTYAALEQALNDALKQTPFDGELTAELQDDGVTIYISDSKGRDLADEFNEVSAGVDVSQKANTETANVFTFAEPDELVSQDRLIFASYEDRADGELVDDDGFVNETGDPVSLGADAYAEDLVVRFDADGNGTTILAEDQRWDMEFENLADEDTVNISVNGTSFALQMGVAADGTAIQETQQEFLARMVEKINAGSDNDTLAGSIVAIQDGDTISIVQGDYYTGQVAFMDEPVVTLGNGSGGEAASVTIAQPNTDSEIALYYFDGRDNALNAENVLFLGGSGMNDGVVTNAENSRSILTTAADEGGELLGSDALVVDSMDDVDTEATDFSLHGDDLLFTGIGDDDVTAGTGDDRIFGSIGDDDVDGGKDLWVVQTLVAGEIVESVVEGNDYDAAQLLAQDDVVAVDLLEEDETGGADDGFVDQLIFSQADFVADTRFTITIDDDLEQQNGGAGTVDVDEGGDGTINATTTFTEMEAIRTLAGDGTHAGQGNDTLDVAALSDAVAATDPNDPDAGVVYNMTSDLGYVQINADLDEDDAINDDLDQNPDNADTADEIDQFIAVDGVERLIGGNANETLNIDEAEVNKDNYFDGGNEITQEGVDPADQDDDPTTDEDPDMVGDSIVYDHTDMDNDGVADDDDDIDNDDDGIVEDADFNDSVAVSMRPSMEIVVESDTDTDLVNMTGGTIIGDDITTDTLVDVETIDVTNAAISAFLDDTIVLASYADYADGEVRESEDGDVLVQITGMTEIENIEGSDDDDGVQVADADAMGTNYRAFDSDDDTTAISYASFLDYANEVGAVEPDGFTADGDFEDTDDDGIADTRVAFTSQDFDDRAEANNQALFTFDLADGQDRVDYSNEAGGIAVVVDLEDAEVAQVVFVDGDDDAAFNELGDDVEDRIDLLKGVEEVVASQGESILDFTGSETNLEINYQSSVDATTIASKDLREHVIDIQDLDTSEPFGDFTYIEYMDADEDDDIDPNPEALWNRIEGSDHNEKIELTDDQSATVHTFNLRGGANEVNYNELTKGIQLSVDSLEGGITTLNIQAKDTAGAILNAGDIDGDGVVGDAEVWTQYDRITSYNAQNDVIVGSLRIEASQSENDSIDFSSLTENNLVILGQTEGAADILTVSFAVDTEEQVNLTLTGFETLMDGGGNDIYEVADLDNFFDTLALVDNPGVDSDTLKLTDGALDSDGGVTWDDDSIELDAFEAEINAQNGGLGQMDFDTLDISLLTETTDYVVTDDADETLVLGDLGNFGDQSDANIDVQGFAKIQFTSTDGMGTDVVVDMDNGEFRQSDGTVLFTFDSANVFDFSAITDDMTVEVIDTGAVGVTIIGDAEDEFTGANGADFLVGGADADTLDGGTTAAVPETHSFTLTGDLDNGANDWSMTFADTFGNTVTLTEAANTDVTTDATAGKIVSGASYLQVGTAIAALDFSALDFDNDGTGDIESVSFDNGTGIVTFTMTSANAGVLDVTTTTDAATTDFDVAVDAGSQDATAGGTLVINTVDGDGGNVDATEVAGVGQQESADIYAYYNAAESTADGMDTLVNFDDTDTIWIHSSIITEASVLDHAAFAAGFTDVDADGFFGNDTIVAGSDGTNGRIWVDVNGDGDLDDDDMVIKVDGAADNNDFDEAGDFLVANFGTPFADELDGVDEVADIIIGLAGNDKIDITETVKATDTVIFAATAALNGIDLITGFDATSDGGNEDKLNVNALLGGLGTFNAGPFDATAVANTNVDSDVSIFDADGTALTAASLAAEFAGGGTAFGAAAGDVAVIVEIDDSVIGENANVWYVQDADSDGTIAETEVALIGVVEDAGGSGFVLANFSYVPV